MRTFEQFKELAQTRKRKLANNTYLEVYPDHFAVRLHDTEVVKHYPDHIVLDSGGWQTYTTKDRMNEFSPVRVYQERKVWYVVTDQGTFPYADGIAIFKDGTVTGEGDDPKAQRKLIRQIKKYAKDYAAAFVAGKVPAPSSGDCWYCSMFPGKHSDHIISHIEEQYYVPSILNHARSRMSQMAISYVGCTWTDQPEYKRHLILMKGTYVEEHAQELIEKAVRWYCYDQCGLPT